MFEAAQNVSAHGNELVRVVGSEDEDLFFLRGFEGVDPDREADHLACTATGFMQSFGVGVVAVGDRGIEIANPVHVVGV